MSALPLEADASPFPGDVGFVPGTEVTYGSERADGFLRENRGRAPRLRVSGSVGSGQLIAALNAIALMCTNSRFNATEHLCDLAMFP